MTNKSPIVFCPKPEKSRHVISFAFSLLRLLQRPLQFQGEGKWTPSLGGEQMGPEMLLSLFVQCN